MTGKGPINQNQKIKRVLPLALVALLIPQEPDFKKQLVMSNLLFYSEPIPLNKDSHRTLAVVRKGGDYRFAAKTNSVLLTGLEFIEACKEYPIVFAKTPNDSLVPVAVVGLSAGGNLFIDHEGRWRARYIPAYVRRYPFVLAETGEKKKFTVCVDRGALDEQNGERLFDDQGKETPYLAEAMAFMQQYQAQNLHAESFVKHLKLLDLLTEMSAKTVLKDQTGLLLQGFFVIDEKKLLKLERSKMQALMKTGELGWIYAHLISLSNFAGLVDRLAERRASVGV